MTKGFYSILFMLCMTGCVPNDEYFVEEGFEGVVVVVYSDPLGIKADGVFHIPKSGILFVKDPSSDDFIFTVYEKLKEGGFHKLVSMNIEPGARHYRRFMGIGGMMTSSACDAGPTIPTISFVVTTSSIDGIWGTLQESQIEKATVESMRHRGVDEEVIACYRRARQGFGSITDNRFPK